MTTVNQRMSVEEIERVVAQQVANAIKAIAIYETKTNMARKSISQTKRQEDKVVENASSKRKWEGNHNGSSSQQNKGHKVPRAHTTRPINKKAYVGSLPLWVRLPSICVIIGADGYAYLGVSNQSFMNVNYKVYDLVSCAMNGIVASYVSAIDKV
ncbi:hypothetical protein Tco_0688630 [Tanacetum coccineum]